MEEKPKNKDNLFMLQPQVSHAGFVFFQCSGKEAQQHSVDVALLFVGREVRVRKS